MDRTKPILVTGATGYVASWVVKRLVEAGYTVHAAIRRPDDVAKRAHLDAIAAQGPGQIRYFDADLLRPGSYAEAMQGCEVVLHTASPFSLSVADPQKQLVEPAVEGTRNVLQQATATPSVRRVVLTSSCAAIYTDCSELDALPDGQFTEAIWNNTASLDYQPYYYSKTLAEREAWRLAAEQEQWQLVVLNPSMVLGPALNPNTATSESIAVLRQFADGSMRFGVPNLGLGVVDVRDLAEAHLAAAESPAAEGRNIVSGHNTSMLEMAQHLHAAFGKQYPIAPRALPKWLLTWVGPMMNKAITRRFVQNNVGLPWRADNSKGRQQLGIRYRPLADTLVDSFRALMD